jgi:hypothetical protein
MEDTDSLRSVELKKQQWRNWYSKNKDKKKQYDKKWRKANPEKVKISKKRWWNKWYSENKEKRLKQIHDYHQTTKWKKYIKGYMKEYEKSPKRIKWRKQYKKNKRNQIKCQELARIIIIPKEQKCQVCENKMATLKHHDDYSKPYEIIFCCKSCHYELDFQRRARENENNNRKTK